jgi:GntR family transcriptional regulator
MLPHVDAEELDPESRMPLYRQLAALLRNRIRDGTYAGLLPSQAQLAQETGLALGTIRRAVALLHEEGLTEPLHGLGVRIVPAGERREPGS